MCRGKLALHIMVSIPPANSGGSNNVKVVRVDRKMDGVQYRAILEENLNMQLEL